MSLHVGVIGMGNRMSAVVRNLLQWEEDVRVTAVADLRPDGARERMRAAEIPLEGVVFYGTAEEMLEKENALDGVMIGTNCDTHARFAELVVDKGLPLFLEKPVFTTAEDSLRMRALIERHPGAPAVVSFPLRMTQLAVAAKEIIDRGELGEISQLQSVNNVAYGRGYFKKWYRADHITGGLFLQKATHDLDTLRYLTGYTPVRIAAMHTHRILKGEMPKGQTCTECERYRTCPESTWVLRHRFNEPAQPPACSFAVDTGNQDAGSVLLLYDSGVHGVYTQNFIARKSAGKRLTRIIGFEATLEFDFVTGALRVFRHQQDRIDTVEFKQGAGHFGGDDGLTRAFIDLMRGKRPECPDLYEGYLSALTCLRAKESAEQQRFLTL